MVCLDTDSHCIERWPTEQQTPTEALPAWTKGHRDRTTLKEKASLPVRGQSELLTANRLDMRLGLLAHEGWGDEAVSPLFLLPPRALNRRCSASHWKTEHQAILTQALDLTYPTLWGLWLPLDLWPLSSLSFVERKGNAVFYLSRNGIFETDNSPGFITLMGFIKRAFFFFCLKRNH